MHPTLSFVFGLMALTGVLCVISTVGGERERNSMRKLAWSIAIGLTGAGGLAYGAVYSLFH